MRLFKNVKNYFLCGALAITMVSSVTASAESDILNMQDQAETETVSVASADTDSVSGKVGSVHIVGSANISRYQALAQTVQTGTSGEVRARCNATYRDVSAGKTKTMNDVATGTVSAQKKWTVSEEDYMKSMTGTHKYFSSNGVSSWTDTTSASR